MIVAVFGSISIAALLPGEGARVRRLMELGATILVSDAPGVDVAVQRILAAAHYTDVTLYHRGAHPRNNLGGWPTVAVQGSYTDKDRAMCTAAGCALSIWDGRSSGTQRNVRQIKGQGKRVRELTRPAR